MNKEFLLEFLTRIFGNPILGIGIILSLIGILLIAVTFLKIKTKYPYVVGIASPIHKNGLIAGVLLLLFGITGIIAKEQFIYVSPAPQIEGTWEYLCQQVGTPYQHGGVCTIKQKTTKFGFEWELEGERMWAADKKNRYRKVLMTPVFHWNTTWGAITADNVIQYSYKITKENGTIDGYARGEIKDPNGTEPPNEIIGQFYQLPPFDPMYGTFTLKRISDPKKPMYWFPKTEK